MPASIDSLNFSFLEALFAETLTPRGFEKKGHQYDGPFGSHYADYVLNGKAYRLIADGRESRIDVDCTDNYSESHFGKSWMTLISITYPSSITRKSIQLCFAKIRDHLAE